MILFSPAVAIIDPSYFRKASFRLNSNSIISSFTAKISGGKVSNVDQVLQIHSDFLSTCLNDCLLSNTQLLSTVKKLLGVCCEFSDFMNQLESLEDFEPFEDDVNKFDLRFTSVLVSLLDRISQLARENYNEKMLNILYRLDFNGFYSKALDAFKSTR